VTKSQESALRWLSMRGGDGYFDNNGVLCARGEKCSYMRATWNALAAFGKVAFYNPSGKGYGRCKVVT
jgi:hypothetical protein